MNFAATLRCVAPWSLRCAVIAAAALASACTADLTAMSVGVTGSGYGHAINYPHMLAYGRYLLAIVPTFTDPSTACWPHRPAPTTRRRPPSIIPPQISH